MPIPIDVIITDATISQMQEVFIGMKKNKTEDIRQIAEA